MNNNLNLDERTLRYLELSREFAEKHKMNIVSIILFGGIVKGYLSKLSDQDIIFVFDDCVPQDGLCVFRDRLEEIEVDLGLRQKNSFLQKSLDRVGAQYKSSFACRRSDFVSCNIKYIFYSGHKLDSIILDNPFWTSDIGLKNIILTAQTVYGESLLEFMKSRMTPVLKKDVEANRRMQLILISYSLVTFFFSKNSTRYALSSVKWALHTCYTGGFANLGTLNDEIIFFKSHLSEMNKNTLDKFIVLRESGEKSLSFIVKSFFLTFSIYRITIEKVKFSVILG